MERIAIVGVGPIGVSIGQSLMKRNLSNTEVVITSGDRAVMSVVQKMEAAHRTIGGLRQAVETAQLVILDAPLGELRELMEAVGPSIEPGAVVTDTVSVKGPVIKWAGEYLPSDASFVGGHPLLKETPFSLEDSDPAIFTGAKYTVTPSDSSDEQSIRTVVGLVEALGAKPVFLDPVEHDSYAAAMHYLPVVISSAFVNSTAGSDGWREMHMLAESQFETFGRHASNDPLDNEAMCLADPDALAHWIDQLILELYEFRNEIKDSSEELIERFVSAWEHRAKWETDAVIPQEGVRIPSAGESIASAMLGEKLAQRLGALRRQEEQQDTKYRSRR